MENNKKSNAGRLDEQIIINFIKDNNLTVKEFCRRCGISQSTYYKIIKGRNFNLLALFRIAKYMNLRVHRFFKDE